MLWKMVESDIKCKAKTINTYWYSVLIFDAMCSNERSPALVVPLVSSWDCQTLVHVTMEQPEHISSCQKT